MSTDLLRSRDNAVMPWRNGLGTTREIVRHDDPETGVMIWRVSLADVPGDSTFSAFPGYRRVISVLEGEGMHLTVDGVKSRLLAPFDPFGFDGGGETRCETVGGPLRDFNLMYDPDVVRARLTWVTAPTRIVGGASTMLVFAAMPLTVHAEAAHALGRHDALLLRGRAATAELALKATQGSLHAAIIDLEAAPRS